MLSTNTQTFESLYRSQIALLHDAELQMIEHMPRLIRAALSPELKTALELHLAETEEQAARLKAILNSMRGRTPQKPSEPMSAMLAEVRLRIAWSEPSTVLDAEIVAAAQAVEHYEIAAYSTARMLATMLNHPDAATLLARSLREEQETAADLAQIAETIVMGEELDDEILEEAVPA